MIKMIKKKWVIACFLVALLGNMPDAFARRIMDRMQMPIDGQKREYFHLYDGAVAQGKPVVLFVNGSSCTDGGAIFLDVFKEYFPSINAYMLQMRGVKRGDSGTECSVIFQSMDQLATVVQDNIEFIDHQHFLKNLENHSIAVIGLGDGGNAALLIASRSQKIGWLATFGSGGLPQSENFLAVADTAAASQPNFYSRDYFEAMFYALLRDPENLKNRFYGFPFRHWKSSLFFDPLLSYAGLHIPILVAMRESDAEVVLSSGRVLRNYFTKHPERDFYYIEFDASKAIDNTGISQFIAAFSQWLDGHVRLEMPPLL